VKQHLAKNKIARPVFLKIAPDLDEAQLNDVAQVAMELKIGGIIATNTTISRSKLKTSEAKVKSIGTGGLSGSPLKSTSTEIIAYLHKATRGEMPIIAVGGIQSAADAKEKIAAGASLVQLYTGFIYRGPSLVKSIVKLIG
jgi:dihydroorotate dehydrogenase